MNNLPSLNNIFRIVSNTQDKPSLWVKDMTNKFMTIDFTTSLNLLKIMMPDSIPGVDFTMWILVNDKLKEKGLQTLHSNTHLGLEDALSSTTRPFPLHRFMKRHLLPWKFYLLLRKQKSTPCHCYQSQGKIEKEYQLFYACLPSPRCY